VESGAQAIIAGRSLAALKPFRTSGAWTAPKIEARAWTDDYVNVFGALVGRMMHPR
jgi:hypothetical protein